MEAVHAQELRKKCEFELNEKLSYIKLFYCTQVSKALLADYFSSLKRKKPVKSVGLDHMNAPRPIIPAKFTSDLLRNSKFQVSSFLSSFPSELEHHLCGETYNF